VRSLIATLALLTLATPACKASRQGGPWAGIDSYEAGNAASDIVGKEERKRTSPLYGEELVVSETRQGEDPKTKQAAWVITLETFGHVRASKCLFLWGNHTPFITHVDYDIDDCPGGGGT
jgi:hypothetical protein